jgi:hypothetical protein
MHQAIDAILCCSSFERAATLSTAASAMAKKIVPKLPLLFRTQHLQKCSDVRYCLPHAFDFKSLLFWWQILPVAILVLCYATLEIKQGQLKTWVQIPLTAYGGEKKAEHSGHTAALHGAIMQKNATPTRKKRNCCAISRMRLSHGYTTYHMNI